MSFSNEEFQLATMVGGTGFCAGVVVTGLFAVRAVRRAIYWHYHQDEPIRPWMSLGYIAHSYNVPPWVLPSSGRPAAEA